MTKRQFEHRFTTLTRCIFTGITAEAAFFLTVLSEPVRSFADAGMYRNIPGCLEHLTAGIVLYLFCASAAALALKESHT